MHVDGFVQVRLMKVVTGILPYGHLFSRNANLSCTAVLSRSMLVIMIAHASRWGYDTAYEGKF